MSAELVEFPSIDVQNVSAQLRKMADQVDAGQHGAAHNLAWVMDCGGRIEVGLLGNCAELAPTLYHLLALGMRKVELASEPALRAQP